MSFYGTMRHLLPRARAWCTTKNKQLRQFFEGLSTALIDSTKLFYDQLWLDIFPDTTRAIDEWEQQFALPSAGLTEQEKRDRLAATWKALGGQDPRYLQDTLQANGFDVYVHEWWEPGSEGAVGEKKCAVPRNPFTVLSNDNLVSGVTITCGNPIATCGNPAATAGASTAPPGYPLVHKIKQTLS